MAIIQNKWGHQKPPPGTRRNFSHPLSQDLVGHWIMNEGNGVTVSDVSAYGNNGTRGTGATWTTGLRGHAIDFNNTTNGSITIADKSYYSATATTPALTVSAWFSGVPLVANGMIVTKGTGGGAFEWALRFPDTGTNIMFNTWDSAGTDYYSVTGTTTLSSGVWYHGVGVVVHGVGASVYLNGRWEATDTTASSANMSDTTAAVVIGKRGDNAAFFDGLIDDVRIYNRALTDSDIAWLYAEPYADMAPMRRFVGKMAGAAPGGFQAAWARGANTVLGSGGVP